MLLFVQYHVFFPPGKDKERSQEEKIKEKENGYDAKGKEDCGSVK